MPRINYSKVFQAPNLKQEDLTSQVNGSETIFTTAGSFLPEQVFIYVNGVLQRLGVEASVSSSNSFTLVDAPQTGSVLYVVYQPS
jgi:hypothetical protein